MTVPIASQIPFLRCRARRASVLEVCEPPVPNYIPLLAFCTRLAGVGEDPSTLPVVLVALQKEWED